MRSNLFIFDIASKSATLLHSFEGHYEAPNWHPTRDELMINGGGRLFRVPLNDPQAIPVETGFATQLNNDHGISPDGKTIYISDKVETGKSCIYRLPFDGGTPERLTEKTPSYWHGLSPDGSKITYAGFRDGTCQTLVADADGANEQVLTNGFDHCDGPDFSADGQWIWFNGEKGGKVDLWRVASDGANLERMTNDALVNWFPHPSPDGQHVLFLAYPEGTEGHPAELNVTLRLMSAKGGQPADLISLFGGQGTINVPCWAPDGQKFAYMTFDLS